MRTRKGFQIESRPSDEEWLILATKSVSFFEFFFIEQALETFAKKYGGEYDGYEREV